jgi:hypothetical protein
MPNRHYCLSKLIVNYISDEKSASSIISAVDESPNERLKNCLGHFFEEYIFLNKDNLSEIVLRVFIPTVRMAVNENAANLDKKKLSNFFYYLTFNVKGMRQLLMLNILDELTSDLKNFHLVNRWLEVLVELNIHQLDIDLTQSKELANLTKIVNQLNKILVKNE